MRHAKILFMSLGILSLALNPAYASEEFDVEGDGGGGGGNEIGIPPFIDKFEAISADGVANPVAGNDELTVHFTMDVSDVNDQVGSPDIVDCTLFFDDEANSTHTFVAPILNEQVSFTYENPSRPEPRLFCEDDFDLTRTEQLDAILVNRPPVITMLSVNPTDPTAGEDTVNVVLQASDEDDEEFSCRLSWGDGSSDFTQVISAGSDANINLMKIYTEAGSKTIAAFCCDAVSSPAECNASQSDLTRDMESRIVNVNAPNINQPPSVTIDTATREAFIGDEIVFTLSLSDDEADPLTCTIDTDDGNTINLGTIFSPYNMAPIRYEYSIAGNSFNPSARCDDGNGNIGSDLLNHNIAITARPNSAPTLSVTSTKTSGFAPHTVTFTYTISDADQDKVDCTIAWGDNSTDAIVASAVDQYKPSQKTHTYNNAAVNPYRMIVTCDDNRGPAKTVEVLIQVLARSDSDLDQNGSNSTDARMAAGGGACGTYRTGQSFWMLAFLLIFLSLTRTRRTVRETASTASLIRL